MKRATEQNDILDRVIHLWTPADRDGAIAVVHEVFDEYNFTWDEEDYHADLYDVPGAYLDQGNPFYVARLNGNVVGTIALELFPTLPGQDPAVTIEGTVRVAGADCSLERLYVSPSARKTGVGTLLMKKVVEEATARGRKRMEIWSDKRFGDAHRLYGKFGAHPIGERICNDPDQSPEWGLAIDLGQIPKSPRNSNRSLAGKNRS